MMPEDVDHYAVLELAPGSPIAEVKSQYRQLAKKYHPDLHGNDAQSQAQFRRVHTAYAFLADAARKADYDAYLRALAALAASSPKPKPSAPPRPSSAGSSGRLSASHPPVARPPSSSGGSFWGAVGDLRMTRAAWLGATAAVILFLLGVGLSVGNENRGLGGPVAGISDDGGDSSGGWTGPDPVPLPDPGPAIDPAPFAASTVPLAREDARPAWKASASRHAQESGKAAAPPAEALVPDAARSLPLPGPAVSGLPRVDGPPRVERRSRRVSAASPVRRSVARAAARRHARDRNEAPKEEGVAVTAPESTPPSLARLTPLPEHTAVPDPPSLAPLRAQAAPAASQHKAVTAAAPQLKASSQLKAAPTRSSQAAPARTPSIKADSAPRQGFIVWEK